MYKVTTPTINLTIPYKAEEINSFIITLEQQSLTVLTLTQDDCQVTDNLVSFSLTQEQTSVFVHRYPIHLQMRIMLTTGKVVASKIEHINVHRVLNEDILTLVSDENEGE